MERHEDFAQVLRGERPIGWSDWAMPIHESQCLTLQGQKVALWAVGTLQHVLGDDFLQRVQTAQSVHPIFSFGLWSANDVPWVYANLFQLAAQIELIQSSVGWPLVRTELRSDLRPDRWISSLLQLEVAGLGLRAGWHLTLEPPLGISKKADVLLTKESIELFAETKAMQASGKVNEAHEFFDRIVWKVHDLVGKYAVQFAGSIGSSLLLADEDQWLQKAEDAARATAQDGMKRVVPNSAGGQLEISRGDTAPGISELEGILVETDVGRRLINQLQTKNEQAANAGPVWVRMDEDAGLWRSTPLQEATLSEKLDSLTPFLQQVLAFLPNLAGVILSPMLFWASNAPPEALSKRIEKDGGIAIRCPLLGHTVRESIIVTQVGQFHDHARIFADWYEQEATWLNWALAQLGHPSFHDLVKEE